MRFSCAGAITLIVGVCPKIGETSVKVKIAITNGSLYLVVFMSSKSSLSFGSGLICRRT